MKSVCASVDPDMTLAAPKFIHLPKLGQREKAEQALDDLGGWD